MRGISLSVYLTHKHRDAKPLAGGLAGQEIEFTLWHMAALTLMLRAFMCEETRAKEHRMLAVLLAQRVHTLIQIGKSLHTNGLAKEIELAVVGLGEFGENHPGSTVRCANRAKGSFTLVRN